MNVIDLEELKKCLGSGITIRKIYKATYLYSKKLVGLFIELDGTDNNLFVPISGCGKYHPGYAHTLLKRNHPFGKIFLTVEDCFLDLFIPILEGMYI